MSALVACATLALLGLVVAQSAPSGHALATAPAASLLVFEGETLAGPGKGRVAVYVARADGTGLRRLPGSGRFSGEPAWSPNGAEIAFISNRGGDPRYGGSNELFVMNASGGGVRQLTFNSLEEHDPAWDPRGRQIAFAGEQGLNVAAADGSVLRKITAEVPLRSPTWSPQGEKLAFSSGPNRKLTSTELYVVSARGTGLRRLAQVKGGAAEPAWSPDGRTVAFVAGRPSNVYLLTTATGKTRRLTRTAVVEHAPSWSPDGKQIVYARGAGRRELWVMNADGTAGRRLLGRTSVSFDRPSWQPIRR